MEKILFSLFILASHFCVAQDISPLKKSNEQLFLNATKMKARNMTVKVNDGQMRTWTNKKSTASIVNVFDIRYQLKSINDAETYMGAQLEMLSEGLTEKDFPEDLKVDEGKYYTGEDMLGLNMYFHNFVFRKGNVVAKVFLSTTGNIEQKLYLTIVKEALANINTYLKASKK